jgi:hypothetical protein
MQIAGKILEYGLLTWFGLLALLLAMRMLTGGILVSGLVTRDDDNSGLAPERVLHIAAFPIVIIYYVHAGLNLDVSAVAENVRPSLPDIPDQLLTLLTGTNSLYLAGKIARSS